MSALGPAHRSQMLGLYKTVMRELQVFPSKNRRKLIIETRRTFKENKTETAPAKINYMIAEAKTGLGTMRQFANGSKVYYCQ